MKKLRSWDPVIVISGKYKGKVSKIESLDGDKVLVKWINEMKKAVKWKGFIKKHLPIHISNIMYYEEFKKQASKIKIEVDAKGKKVRKLKKLDLIIK